MVSHPSFLEQGGLSTQAGCGTISLNLSSPRWKSYQYDLACNGYELLSGAIRNHELETMFKAFELAGYSKDEVSSKFQGIIEGLKYGPPPHGGCALGIDRMIMLLAEEENIREVIMFPMNQKGEDLMMNAPTSPTNEQLRELNLRVIEQDTE